MKILSVDPKRGEARVQVYESDGLVLVFRSLGASKDLSRDVRKVGTEDLGGHRLNRSHSVRKDHFLKARNMAIEAIEGARAAS